MPYTARSNEPYGFKKRKVRSMYGRRRKNPWFLKAFVVIMALAVLGHLAYVFWLRDWVITWGATRSEVSMSLPGDGIVPDPMNTSTRAVTINAPRDKVWPWIVQMGQNKGGLYSYAFLENLVGCQVTNSDKVLPEYQDPKVGDLVTMGPKSKGYPYYYVDAVSDRKAFVWRGSGTDDAEGSWSFNLFETPSGRTRLIARQRGSWKPGWAADLIWGITERLSFVMERKMLLTIKALAEANN